jgi:hypothetical protein
MMLNEMCKAFILYFKFQIYYFSFIYINLDVTGNSEVLPVYVYVLILMAQVDLN